MKSVSLTRLFSLALPLCLAAGCMSAESPDDDNTDTASTSKVQSFGNTCHIQRPYSWNTARWRCLDSQGGVLDMATGETADLITSSPPLTGWGYGRVRLTCNADGSWTESRKICQDPGSSGGN